MWKTNKAKIRVKCSHRTASRKIWVDFIACHQSRCTSKFWRASLKECDRKNQSKFNKNYSSLAYKIKKWEYLAWGGYKRKIKRISWRQIIEG